jgi:hypothetical protein
MVRLHPTRLMREGNAERLAAISEALLTKEDVLEVAGRLVVLQSPLSLVARLWHSSHSAMTPQS